MQPPDARRPSPARNTSPHESRRLLRWLVIVIALWGIYLAVGATGAFTDVGLFDARRSVIVLACSAMFLGLWLVFLARRRRPAMRLERLQPNRPSQASLLAILVAYALWGGAWAAWFRGNPMNLTFVLGWISLALFALSTILAIIGLSDPLRERGKLWGLLTLVLFLLAGVGLILQVRHYSRTQSEPGSADTHAAGRAIADLGA
jgi:nitrate reductase NapE component